MKIAGRWLIDGFYLPRIFIEKKIFAKPFDLAAREIFDRDVECHARKMCRTALRRFAVRGAYSAPYEPLLKSSASHKRCHLEAAMELCAIRSTEKLDVRYNRRTGISPRHRQIRVN